MTEVHQNPRKQGLETDLALLAQESEDLKGSDGQYVHDLAVRGLATADYPVEDGPTAADFAKLIVEYSNNMKADELKPLNKSLESLRSNIKSLLQS